MIEQEPAKTVSPHKEPFSATQQQFTRGVEILYERGREVLTSLPVDHKPKLRSESAMANMARLYLFSPMSYWQIGGLYGVSGETAREYVNEGVRDVLVQSGLADTQSAKRFSLDKRPAKPERKSATNKASSSNKIEYSTPFYTLSPAERRRDFHARYSEILGLLNNPDTPPEVSCELIKEISYNVYKFNTDIFCGIRSVATEAGLFPSTRGGDSERIARFLEQHGIPSHHIQHEVKTGKQKGTKHYWITVVCQKDKAIKLLENAPEFKDMKNAPITVIGDFKGTPPTTFDIHGRKDGEYHGIGSLLIKLGIGNTNPLFKTICQTVEAEDLPFPRFKTRSDNKLFYREEHKALVSAFLAQKIEELNAA